MKYTTRLYGAPYGIEGEQGGETTAPLSHAKRVLHAGQRMDCYRVSDRKQEQPVKRYVCGPTGDVYEVVL